MAKLTHDEKNALIMRLDTLIQEVNYRQSMRVQDLFDPVQTHAVYGVHKDQVDEIKLLLKNAFKATRFRIVKCGIVDVKIVCFKLA